MKLIPLTRGLFAKVDDADFIELSKRRWYALRTAPNSFYAATSQSTLMHRVILPGFEEVDHINQDKLDNQRKNLRGADSRKNKANIRRRKDNTSGFKGVSLDLGVGLWRADISVKGRHKFLGHFEVVHDAAKAYDNAALREFGKFACVNFSRNGKHQ